MNPNAIYKQIALTVLRYLIAIAAAWFVNHGIFTEEQATTWVPEVAIGALTLLTTVGIAVWARIKHRVGFLAALELPKNSTPEDVKAVVSELSAGEKLAVAFTKQEPPAAITGDNQ